jgi:hypothetical protein
MKGTILAVVLLVGILASESPYLGKIKLAATGKTACTPAPS